MNPAFSHRPGTPQSGFTIVELMIAMVLGLLVIGSAVSVVIANSQAYKTNSGLSQIQESSRTAFELLAREMREAGDTGCGNRDRIANTLKSSSHWWNLNAWTDGVRGYTENETAPAAEFGSNVGDRVAGTDALIVQGVTGTGLAIETHSATSAQFKINAATTSFDSGDILIACDFDHATIFQATSYNSNNVTVVHNTGGSSPGNCSKGLGYPADCSSTNGNPYEFGPNSQIAAFSSTFWYIGNNGRPEEGGRSLYRRRLGSGATTFTEEIVPGVLDMQLEFRDEDSSATGFVTSTADWAKVTAVQITLTILSADRGISTNPNADDGRLKRNFTTIVGLRNRLP